MDKKYYLQNTSHSRYLRELAVYPNGGFPQVEMLVVATIDCALAFRSELQARQILDSEMFKNELLDYAIVSQ